MTKSRAYDLRHERAELRRQAIERRAVRRVESKGQFSWRRYRESGRALPGDPR